MVCVSRRVPNIVRGGSLGERAREMGAPKSVNRSEYEGPDSVASVCDRNQQPAAVGSGRDWDSNRCPGQMAASVMNGRNSGNPNSP